MSPIIALCFLVLPELAIWAIYHLYLEAKESAADPKGERPPSFLAKHADNLVYGSFVGTVVGFMYLGVTLFLVLQFAAIFSIAVLLVEYLWAAKQRRALVGIRERSPQPVESAWLIGPILLVCLGLYAIFGGYFDFEAALLLLVVVSGLVVFVAKKSGKGTYSDDKEHLVVDYARTFFPVIIVVLVLRTFAFEPFNIPSGSMLPTLKVGDFILVKKYSYGIKLPLSYNKIIEVGQPERGDVVVFRYPPDPSKDYIKRVIGLPGDVVSYRDKTVYINGQPAVRSFVEPYNGTGREHSAQHYSEDLLGMEHDILVNTRSPSIDGETVVPEGQYFVMGDNRDNSLDSRKWGFVEDRHLAGKAVMIWMNWDAQLGRPNWSRIGTGIQ